MVQYSGGGGAQAGVQGGYAPLDSGLHVPLQYLNGITPTQLAAGAYPAGKLGYAQITANITTTSVTFADAPGLSVAVTIGSRPVKVTVFADAITLSTTAQNGFAQLVDVTSSTVVAQSRIAQAVVNGDGAAFYLVAANLTPPAGARTYKLQWETSNATCTLTMAAGATFPAFILVEEI